jgi:hypothetical protein
MSTTPPVASESEGKSKHRPSDWKALLGDDLCRAIGRDRRRWAAALMAIGWIHLAGFLACQAIYDPAVESDPRHLGLWIAEFVAVLAALTAIVGRGWSGSSPAVSLVASLWGTFLILGFNLVTMNAMTGWSLDWYRPAWATMSTFLFASLAWLFDLRFLAFAVQMYFTGLLMVRFPDWAYATFGLSWWAALQALAYRVARGLKA